MEPFDLRALSRPAYPPPRCPQCSTFAQQDLFASRQGIGLLIFLFSIPLPSPPWAPAPAAAAAAERAERAAALRAGMARAFAAAAADGAAAAPRVTGGGGGRRRAGASGPPFGVVVVGGGGDPRGWRKPGEPGPELARHVLVEAQVVLLVELTQSLGEARIQLHPRVRRPEVGRGADQGFNVGHKVLGEVRGLGKLDVMLGRRGWERRGDECLNLLLGSWGVVPPAWTRCSRTPR